MENNMFFGIHPVQELCRAGKDIEKIFVQSGLKSPQLAEIMAYAKAHNVPVQHVPVEKLNRLTRKNHQGIVAFTCQISYQLLEEVVSMAYDEGKMPFIVILDRVTDVRNFGAIARTCYAAGVDAIVVPSRGAALINGDAMKTSAGALSLINVCRVDNIKDAIDYLKSCGLKVLAFSEKGRQSIWRYDMSGPLAVIMGSEEDGISEAYLKRADEHLIIPMVGDIDSLNKFKVLKNYENPFNPEGALRIREIENHDQKRIVEYTSYFAKRRNLLAYSFFLDGPMFIYNGLETKADHHLSLFTKDLLDLSIDEEWFNLVKKIISLKKDPCNLNITASEVDTTNGEFIIAKNTYQNGKYIYGIFNFNEKPQLIRSKFLIDGIYKNLLDDKMVIIKEQ